MSLNLATLLTESTKSNPQHTAVIFDDFKLSYSELNKLSNQFAHALTELGVQPGQKVAMMLPNIPQFLICYYGILKTGAVVVPLNVLLKAPEVAYHLADSDAVALVVWEGFVPEAIIGYRESKDCHNFIVVNMPGVTNLPEGDGVKSFEKVLTGQPTAFDMCQTQADDTAVILYTSGTTGQPKGAELTHLNMLMNARMMIESLGVDWTPQDVILMALPMFHAYGQSCVMNMGITAGATLSLLARFDPVKAFDIIQRDKVTAFSGVPTMYFYLLNHPDRKNYDLSSLNKCTSGGSAIPVEVIQNWKAETGITILEGYGLSETSPVSSFNVLYKPARFGSIGFPIWGVDMRIVDENEQELPVGQAGELVIRGHNVMKGYYKRPDATTKVMKGGWFHSGDVAVMDEDGYFFIVDRKKDMIIRGGFNVYPREVEEVLYTHPAIAECAVIGVPDDAMGEEVKAVLVLKPGNESLTTDDFKAFCKQRIASNKYPRIIEISTKPLPKNATGKILKRELKG